ncbi:hypothetical protein TD95_002093 [Thielaviopsis punctulata]|uniref:Uncharacterized protein n=1 Tax=Thielaviopsis punctulata TaxID=72032 RepID=A0A0F4Z9P6_9PEZI|nr:hypothetical protein TD95_002093 [Thielaviopsis punctulata]
MPPEVVAPAPQRVMPEVPQNMQDDLQRMELEAGNISNPNSPSIPGNLNATSSYQSLTSPGNPSPSQNPTHRPTMSAANDDLPSFSPFPKVKGEGVPLSDDDTEGVLWSEKDAVLNSQDVQRQINWSKEVLTWVDTASEAAKREPLDPIRSSTPRIEHELRIAAVNIINYLADQGHPEGLFIRAKWYEFGKFNMRLDKREAFNGYRSSAELGFVRAEYRMGMFYESSGDMAKAIEHYQRGLSAGDSASAYRMGMMSLLGQHGQIMNYQRGIDLVNQAADTSDEDAPQGAYVLGMLIARELPDINLPESILPMDFSRAKWYIERAAFLGFAKAQLKMGQAFELCQMGCDFNPSLSLHYYALAAKQNMPEACLGVSRWFLFGYEGFFVKNEKLAYKYALEAANAKLSTGQFAVGYYNEIGIHVPKDVREARRWYELAADNGNKDAIGRLESLNQQKTLTKKDHETVALGRIKSQHGSMRGKRPERFKQVASAMPAVSEDNYGAPAPQHASPGVSPQVYPGNPQQDVLNIPDVSNLSLQDKRPPAFTVNLQGQNGPPSASAPYPEDDMHHSVPVSPQYNSNMRSPVADQPNNAFGIRPTSAGGRPLQGGPNPQMQMGRGGPRPNGNMGNNLVPQHNNSSNNNNFRQSTGQPMNMGMGMGMGMNNGNYPNQRPMSAQPPPTNYGGPPSPGHLQKVPTNASMNNGYQGPGPQGPPMQGNYNQRPHSGLPMSQSANFDSRTSMGPRPGSAAPNQQGPGQGRGGMGPRPTSGPGGYMEQPGRVGSAPPAQSRPPQGPSTPMSQSQGRPSPAQTPAQTPPKPAKPSVPPPKGPATFEEMGIPQGKADGDCVVM